MTKKHVWENKQVEAYCEIQNEDKGIVTHLISVYGIVDSKGDIAHRGMFTKTLQERQGDIVVVDTHIRDTILASVGKPLSFKELTRDELPLEVKQKWPKATGGMSVETQFLLETPEGLGVFKRIKAGVVKSFSFSFKALDYKNEMQNGKRIRHLRTVYLSEYGPCLFPANSGAVVMSVKAETLKIARWQDQVKSLSLDVQIEEVDRAFIEYLGINNGSFAVREVFTDFIVVSRYIVSGLCYYKVPYTLENSVYTFEGTGVDDWQEGRYEFVLIKVEEENLAENDSLNCILPKLNLELLEIDLILTEAGPESI